MFMNSSENFPSKNIVDQSASTSQKLFLPCFDFDSIKFLPKI